MDEFSVKWSNAVRCLRRLLSFSIHRLHKDGRNLFQIPNNSCAVLSEVCLGGPCSQVTVPRENIQCFHMAF